MLTRLTLALAISVATPALSPASAEVPPEIQAKIDAQRQIAEAQVAISQAVIGGDGAKIAKLEDKALRLAREIFGPEDRVTLDLLSSLALTYVASGRHARARVLLDQVIPIKERLFGRDHHRLASDLESLLSVHLAMRDGAAASRVFDRVLAIREKQLEKVPEALGSIYLGYAVRFMHAYNFTLAERLFRQAIAAFDAHKPGTLELAGALFHAANMQWSIGHLDQSDASMARALPLFAKHHGETHWQYAAMVEWQARRDLARGRAEVARARFEQVEPIYKAALAKARDKGEAFWVDHHQSYLVAHYVYRGQPDKAWPILEQQLKDRERQHGKGSIHVTLPLLRMATLALEAGDAKRALPPLVRSAKIEDSVFKTTRILTGNRMLVEGLKLTGDLKGAAKQAQKLVKLAEDFTGRAHPGIEFYRERLGTLHLAMGQVDKALGHFETTLERVEPMIELILATGSETDNRAYMSTLGYQIDLALTTHLHHAAASPRAAKLAIRTILLRKARVLDAVSQSMRALRHRLSPAAQKVLDDLAAARAALSRLMVDGRNGALKPADFTRQLARLEREVRALEEAARAASARIRAQTAPVTLDAVRARIPEGAALVELVRYHRFDPTKLGPAQLGPERYAAYVVAHDPKAPIEAVDLGPTDPVDAAIRTFRQALLDPKRGDVDRHSRALYDLTWRRIVPLVGRAKHLLVAPDGPLTLVPFGALIDDNGRHLVRRFTFTYLASGRELVRGAQRSATRSKPAVFADPEFALALPATAGQRRSRDLATAGWKRLPGTRAEAQAVASALAAANPEVSVGSAATEAHLKALSGPAVLHVATHGFFLEDQRAGIEEEIPPIIRLSGLTPVTVLGPPRIGPAPGPAAPGSPAQAASSDRVRAENPLLRSGLVLADAAGGEDDGILTALEASGLDLWGTQLVVLSACETGVGAVSSGEGVQGLRRALVLAGAESQVMTLWKVDDTATRELMTSFYAGLAEGKGPSEALREVQAAMLRSERYAHPYYWAAFIPSGRWAPLALGSDTKEAE